MTKVVHSSLFSVNNSNKKPTSLEHINQADAEITRYLIAEAKMEGTSVNTGQKGRCEPYVSGAGVIDSSVTAGPILPQH